MKKFIFNIGVLCFIILFVLSACRSDIIYDDCIDDYIASSETPLPESSLPVCESGIIIDENDDDYNISLEFALEEIADVIALIDTCTLLSDYIFIGSGAWVGDGGGDELAWYFDMWGFGASGISTHIMDIVGMDAFYDWKHQFARPGNTGWRNRREANLVSFINDLGITVQDLIRAQESLYGKPMHEIEALINWARYGDHSNADAHERSVASFWAWSYSLSDMEALVSNNVTAIWAAFPGAGIYNNGRAYSPEWVLNNMEAAVLQEQLPPAEIVRILELASHYQCLDDIRYEAEIAFHAAMANIGGSTPTPPPGNPPTHTGTLTTAPWRIYPDGTLAISPGSITWPAAQSPWHNYREIITQVVIEGPITAGPSLRGLFAHLANVTEITGLNYLDTTAVTNMRGMFNGAGSLAYLDVSAWDTSNVTDMAAMFNSIAATSLDVSGWDTSRVSTMNRMFQYANNLTTLDVSNWDTGNVTDMEAIFHDTAITTLDVSGWNTSQVTTMNRMFQRTPNLAALDVSRWDTGNVTDMTGIFDGATSLTALDISNWDTGRVVQMRRMFTDTRGITTLDVSRWDVGSVETMEGMFSGAGVTTLDLSRWDTGNVRSMSTMFTDTAISSLDLSNWNTANVTTMNRMFQRMANLETLNISGFDTGNVRDMFQMFSNASALRQLSLGDNFRFVENGGAIMLRAGTWGNAGGVYTLTTPELMMHHNASPAREMWIIK